jgi:photosystem II stability/assembly factor-like uncharacterized protein
LRKTLIAALTLTAASLLAASAAPSMPRGTTASSLAPLPHGNGAGAFAFDPRRPNVVYVVSAHASGGVYVFKTIDGGLHWHSTNARGTGWESDDMSLTADPRRSGTLYAGTDTAVYKTVDGGRRWRPFNRGLFPRPHKVCRCGGCGGFGAPGTPGRTSWNRDNGYVLDVAVDPMNRSVVYSAAGGVRKSANGGRTWKTVLETCNSVTRIAIAPTRPESIYAILHKDPTGAAAIYKSTNAGRTWRATGSSAFAVASVVGCCGDSMDALAIDPANPQTLYAAVGNTIFATTNGGASWHRRANGLPVSVTSLADDPRRPGTLYASVHRMKLPSGMEKPTGGIYQSTNGGRTWTEVWSGFGIDKVAVNPTRPATIYAQGDHLLRSTNGGRTWTVAG